jgi:hypothetical protein
VRRTSYKLLAAIAALTVFGELEGGGPMILGDHDAHAVVGRPLTPVSYAGVARRTTRRATYAGAYAGGGYGYAAGAATGAAVATAATISTLPAGCAFAGGIYTCGAARYRPSYDGPNVVYSPVE